MRREIPPIIEERHLNRSGPVQNGMLTKADRNYLVGLKEFDRDQDRYNHRSRLRSRIKYTLQDFELLYYSSIGRELMQGVIGNELDRSEDVIDGLHLLFGSIFMAMYAKQGEDTDFGEYVERGVIHALQAWVRPDHYHDITINCNFTDGQVISTTKLVKRFNQGTLLSNQALAFLYRNENISKSEYESYLEKLSAQEWAKMNMIDNFPEYSALTRPDEIQYPSEDEEPPEGWGQAIGDRVNVEPSTDSRSQTEEIQAITTVGVLRDRGLLDNMDREEFIENLRSVWPE